jgi:metal-dependent amidase/aminoacylase/carboxypeptidase family protein
VFFAVPAEEYVELAYRERLRKDGKIHLLGGKQELIYKGEFDGVDMAMMIHVAGHMPKPYVRIDESTNGFVGKTVRYIGKAAHAAAAPEAGVNALNAAMLGLFGIHALRETFRDEDCIRVHPIITKGGDLVNVVPADVRLESYVRAKTMDAILATNDKVNRALRAGADAIGAQCEITTLPGYLPLACSQPMYDIFTANTLAVNPDTVIEHAGNSTGSTEMGDLSHIMPAIHPWTGGVSGSLHGADFKLEDFDAAVIQPAKAMAMTVIDLFADGAAQAKKIIAESKPLLTADQYRAAMDNIFTL